MFFKILLSLLLTCSIALSTSLQCEGYIYQNDTCLPTCLSPYIQGDSVDGKTCTFPCPIGQYLFGNGTCSAQCSSPYVARVEAVGHFCSFPCISDQFLYRNGSCISTCPRGFIFESRSPEYFCTNPCSSGQYLYENGSCLATCRSDFIQNIYGAGAQADMLCNFPCGVFESLYPDGSCALDCTGNFTRSHQRGYDLCIGTNGCPSPFEYIYQNETCSSSCPAPYIVANPTYERRCLRPCPTGQYLLSNGTCTTTCHNFFIPREDGLCSNPCPSSQYLFRNGSCLSTCPRGFTYGYEVRPYYFCINPCSSGQYLYENGSCLATCRSDFTEQIYGVGAQADLLCNFPCGVFKYLYPNGTCGRCTGNFTEKQRGIYTFCELNPDVTNTCPIGFLYQNESCRESCPFPYISVLDAGATKRCNLPCRGSKYYYTLDGTCVDGCDVEFITIQDGIRYCNGGIYNNTYCVLISHVDNIITTNCTEPTGTCPPGYFLWDDFTCNQTCPDKFTPYLDATCYSPCGLESALYPDGNCGPPCSGNFTTRMEGNFMFCDQSDSGSFPCKTNEYLYANGSCLDSCIFIPINEDGDLYCSFPCQDYIYQNDTCLPTCLSPYIQGDSIDGKTCTFPCPIGQYLFDNITCSAECPAPYVARMEAVGHFCSFPCNPDQFFYQNGSCLLTCPFPYISILDGGTLKLCNSPCPANNYYYSLNDSCFNDCKTEFRTVKDGILYCDNGVYNLTYCVLISHPNDNTTTTNCTEPTGTCPSGYFLFEDFTCNKICPDKFIPHLNATCSSPCGLENALYPNGSCLPSCTGNFTPRKQGNFTFCDSNPPGSSSPCKTNEYLYANGSCLNSCIYNPITENGYLYCRFQCEGYLYQNNTCLSTCLAPYIQGNTTDKNGKTCTFPCAVGKYLFDNGTCSAQCPTPYISRIEPEGRFCSFACSSNLYLYRNGSCLPTCPDGFVFKYQSPNYFCTNPCSSGQYLYSNGSCLATCRSDFIKQIYGVGAQVDLLCNYPCKIYESLYPNGTCAGLCTGDFISQYQGGYLFCIGINGCPSPLEYKYQNGTCSSSCPAPFIIGNSTAGRKCLLPCSTGQYLLNNGTCSATCPNFYIVRQDGLCSNPCSANQYLYRNGSCLSTCADGFVFKYQSPDYFCTNPCSSGQYLYENGSCLTLKGLTTCRSDFIKQIYGVGAQVDMLCNYPCKIYESLYPNGTCAGLCTGDFISQYQGGYLFCIGINGCPSPLEYKYQNGTCSSSCPAPFIIGNSTAGRKCLIPCPSGQYLLNNGTCSATCPNFYIVRQDGLCSNPCSANQYLYRNGSCLSTCADGFVFKYQSPDYFCTNPCSSEQYLYSNGSCLATCRSDFIEQVYGSDMLCNYPCKIYESLYPNGTCAMLCTGDFISQYQSGYSFCQLNPYANNKCPIGFLYQDGSCKESCPFPYISVLDAGATKLCNLPCPANKYYYNGTCVNDCEIEFRTTKDGILYCDGGIYNYTYCALTTNVDKTTTTNCTELTGTCPSGYFLFEDSTCNKICPEKFTARLNATCSSPCGLNSALYPNGSCLPSCTGDFTTRMQGNFMFCDASDTSVNASYTAVLEIYIRYNINVSDFYDQSGITKFLKLLAELFGIDISQITILNIREGSTIIESKVTLTSDSDSKSKATTNSKIQTMSQTFENAAQANNLNLEDIKVLNYRSSVVIPVVTPEQGHIQVEESSSNAVVIGVAVGAGLAVIAVGITVYSVYRRRQKHKMRRVAKTEAYKVEVNPAVDQQEKNNDQSKDEEFYGLAHASIIQIKENAENNVDQTQNRIEPFESARKDFESNQPDPLEKIDEASGCKEDTLKSNGNQVVDQLEEVEDQKAMSLNEIMKKIEVEVNGENPIELNFEN